MLAFGNTTILWFVNQAHVSFRLRRSGRNPAPKFLLAILRNNKTIRSNRSDGSFNHAHSQTIFPASAPTCSGMRPSVLMQQCPDRGGRSSPPHDSGAAEGGIDYREAARVSRSLYRRSSRLPDRLDSGGSPYPSRRPLLQRKNEVADIHAGPRLAPQQLAI